MEGGSDKGCITGTFSITFSNEFLPTLLIYDGKTVKSLPRFKFPQQFSLSANPTHFSNSSEFIKLFEEVVNRYLQKSERNLTYHRSSKAWLLWMFSKDRWRQRYLRSSITTICVSSIFHQTWQNTINLWT